jgi:glycosyltransferase involved in cell wall biosynthesis
MPITLSVVIPIYNEIESIQPMIDHVQAALAEYRYEMILVDDGSQDGSREALRALTDPHIQVVLLSRNFGQTSAIAAGIEVARGTYIATIDGDLQNDASDIPKMLEKLKAEKLDMVAGIRLKRQDGMVLRKIPSFVANLFIRTLTKVDIKDAGCTLKLFKAPLAKQLDLYGELHRFIPVLAHMHGAKIGQMHVKHHARQFGTSKYGIGRTLRVLSDLFFMLFMQKYRQKPMHLFGTLGFSLCGIGGVIEAYLLVEKCMGHDIGARPLFYVGFMSIIAGLQLITTGFMAELIMRTYYESQAKKPYTIRTHLRAGKPHDAD